MENRKLKTVVLSFLLLALVLSLTFFTVGNLTRPEVSFASENGQADANQTPADANEGCEQKQKTAKDKEVPRPQHSHPAFSQRIEERATMVKRQIEGHIWTHPSFKLSFSPVFNSICISECTGELIWRRFLQDPHQNTNLTTPN